MMKPWFLVRTPTGACWHVVREFAASWDDWTATIMCRSGWMPTDPNRQPTRLEPGDRMCSHCAAKVRRHAEWMVAIADSLDAHTA